MLDNQSTIIILTTILLGACTWFCIFIVISKRKKDNLYDIIEAHSKTITSQDTELEILRNDVAYFKGRTEHLEDKVEQDYGVSVRNVVTEVKADFSKLEMVVMQSGVMKVLKNSDNVDDIEFYLKLSKKIQGFLDKMKDDSEDSPKKE